MLPFPLQRNQKMHPTSPNQPSGFAADTVPPMPQPASSPPISMPLNRADFDALHSDAMALREAARRIEAASRTIQNVASTTNVKLSRRDKGIVVATCVGLVGVGVVGTLGWQRFRRGRPG